MPGELEQGGGAADFCASDRGPVRDHILNQAERAEGKQPEETANADPCAGHARTLHDVSEVIPQRSREDPTLNMAN